MKFIANPASSDTCAVDAWHPALRVCVLACVFVAVACSSVRPVDAPTVRGRGLPLSSAASTNRHCARPAVVSPGTSSGERFALLDILRGIQCDFGTTLTPRHLASRLNAPARSSESLGAWVFEPPGSLFDVDAYAMSIDSPIDWLRVTIRAELGIHLADLTKLFSDDYSLLHGGAEFLAVEFRSTRRMYVAAELRNDRPAYIASAPVVSVQLRRPGYEPSSARLASQER
jgi:hypothetical protein